MMSRPSEWEPNARGAVHCVLARLAAKVSAGVQSPQRPRLHQLRTGTEARTALRASQQRALQPPGVSRCAPHAGPLNRNTKHSTSRLIEKYLQNL